MRKAYVTGGGRVKQALPPHKICYNGFVTVAERTRQDGTPSPWLGRSLYRLEVVYDTREGGVAHYTVRGVSGSDGHLVGWVPATGATERTDHPDRYAGSGRFARPEGKSRTGMERTAAAAVLVHLARLADRSVRLVPRARTGVGHRARPVGR